MYCVETLHPFHAIVIKWIFLFLLSMLLRLQHAAPGGISLFPSRGGMAPPYLTKMPALSSMNSKRAGLMGAAATSRQFCSLCIPFPLKTHQPDLGALSCIAGLSSKCLVEWSLQKTPHDLHSPTCAMHVEYSVQNDTQKCHSKSARFHRLQRRRERNCGGCSIN